MQPTNKQILEWFEQSSTAKGLNQMDMPAAHVARMAYAAGADAELEACCKWLEHGPFGFSVAANAVPEKLHAARRPKPPSLKQQALEALDRMDQLPTAEDQHIIRRALEQLDD